MENQTLTSLKKALQIKEFQLNSLYEFSTAIYTSFDLDHIIRILFSTLMGQLGISRIFFFMNQQNVFKNKGGKLNLVERREIINELKKLKANFDTLNIDELDEKHKHLAKILKNKKIKYIINLSEHKRKKVFLCLGSRFNKYSLSEVNLEFSFFLSRFALIGIENTFLISKIIDNERIESELKIAQEIQRSLLPSIIPKMKNFDMAIIYEPINEVGGDYYDILKERNGLLPVLLADVEGKGLSAALLAASSQSILRSLNELYFFEPSKFIAKANTMIYQSTQGNRFITLFWMLINDEEKKITYINAGHVEPLLITQDRTIPLSKGGLLTGFTPNTDYEKETLEMKDNDILVAFTDGVSEVQNSSGKEFDSRTMADFLRQNRHLPITEIRDKFYRKIKQFNQHKRFSDDFTVIIIKVKTAST